MIKVAICDDDLEFCKILEKMIIQIFDEINLQAQIDVFQSGNKLNDLIKAKYHFDILFLDIELIELKGMNIGETIRNEVNDEDVYIVYVSSQSHYVMELFKTRPLDFLMKPIGYDKLKETIIRFKQLYYRRAAFFEYQYKKQYYKIRYDEILYFESQNKKIIIKLYFGEKEFYGKLNEIEERTQDTFLSIHKSYLVNIDKIIKLTYEYVILINGQKLSISQSKRQMVRKRFFEMKKTKKGVSYE